MYKIGGRGCTFRYKIQFCNKTAQILHTVKRTPCSFTRDAPCPELTFMLSRRHRLLRPRYQFSCRQLSVNLGNCRVHWLFTLHCGVHKGLFSTRPIEQIKSRCFSTQETFDSLLKIQAGLFKSLSESTVVGYAKESIIFMHETTGLPWWGSIMLITVILRSCFTLPFTIYQNYILAKVENLTLEMPQIAKQLQMETTYAIKKLHWTEAQAKIAYKRSLKKQWNKLIVRDNCHPFKAGIVLWVQISLWVIYSTALRNMVYMLPSNDLAARVLNMELSVGGTLWFPNLTMCDSSLILPVTFGLLNLIIIELQEITRVRKSSKFQKYATNFFRVLSVVMVPIAAGVPSCLCLYWTTSSMTGLLHNLIMLSPRVRRLGGIPATPSELAHPYLHIKNELQKRLSLNKVEKQ